METFHSFRYTGWTHTINFFYCLDLITIDVSNYRNVFFLGWVGTPCSFFFLYVKWLLLVCYRARRTPVCSLRKQLMQQNMHSTILLQIIQKDLVFNVTGRLQFSTSFPLCPSPIEIPHGVIFSWVFLCIIFFFNTRCKILKNF